MVPTPSEAHRPALLALLPATRNDTTGPDLGRVRLQLPCAFKKSLAQTEISINSLFGRATQPDVTNNLLTSKHVARLPIPTGVARTGWPSWSLSWQVESRHMLWRDARQRGVTQHIMRGLVGSLLSSSSLTPFPSTQPELSPLSHGAAPPIPPLDPVHPLPDSSGKRVEINS